ncbi:MAG TPA: FlgO family outer membrane protein [Candidatus Acidoferrales bacterium]|nr:FlgO family outer membrane protein [Candidatus Acidoferrales bacterium]
MIGQTLGHYRIIEKIGAGGMGNVYRARDEQLDRDVALKVLPPGMLKDEKARRRFRNEALLLAKLNHPNVAIVHEFDTEAGADFLVMECVAGVSLAQKLEAGPLPEKEILVLAMQVAQALQEAHERGIVHRDLKPGNIIITPKGWAKVLDFGIARLLRPAGDTDPTQSITGSHGAAGTLPYMSPEQLRGEAAGPRSDIFSFGAVLYEMASGRRPCQETLPSRLIDAIVRERPVPPRTVNPRISPEFERIAMKCLEKEPENRYQSAKELEVDLRRLQTLTSGPVALTAAPKLSLWRDRMAKLASAAAVIALIIVLALVVRSWRAHFAPASGSPRIQSLAVLPLENLSGDPQQAYFTEGMTEELTTQLAQISELRVISQTSVTPYQGAQQSLQNIGKELHVDAVVEGSVMRSNDRVRITARLIRVSNGNLLWTQAYDRKLEDVLALQDEVARAIASEVKVTLTPDEQARLAKPRSVNQAAYDAYLQGTYLNKGTSSQHRRARDYFEQAIKLDPNYAPAYAGLADYYWSDPGLDPRAAMPQARKYAQDALERDPNLADAHTTLGAIHFYADWNWVAAEDEFRRAIALSPSDAEAHRSYSYFLAALGRPDEALAESTKAQELDPLSIWAQLTAGYVFYFTRYYDKAVDQCQKALVLDPNSVGAYDCLGTSYLAEGKYEQAIAAAQKACDLSNNDPTRLVGLGRAYALAGRKTDALKVLDQLRQLSSRTYVPPYFFATIYAALGERDEAFTWLETAFRERDRYMAWLKVDGAIDPLRSDARLTQLLRQVGLINN